MKIDETCAALTEKHKVEVGHNNNVKQFIVQQLTTEIFQLNGMKHVCTM